MWLDYQQDAASSIISLNEIYEYLKNNGVELKNTIVFCGTVPLLDGFKYGTAFKCGIRSEKLDKTISIEYKVNILMEA